MPSEEKHLCSYCSLILLFFHRISLEKAQRVVQMQKSVKSKTTQSHPNIWYIPLKCIVPQVSANKGYGSHKILQIERRLACQTLFYCFHLSIAALHFSGPYTACFISIFWCLGALNILYWTKTMCFVDNQQQGYDTSYISITVSYIPRWQYY